MSSVFSPSEPLKASRSNSRVPSHLYKRQGLYYFRVVIADKLKPKFNRSELRLSLKTAYRRLALERAKRLYILYSELVKTSPMLITKNCGAD